MSSKLHLIYDVFYSVYETPGTDVPLPLNILAKLITSRPFGNLSRPHFHAQHGDVIPTGPANVINVEYDG